jgi:hypothetical protein
MNLPRNMIDWLRPTALAPDVPEEGLPPEATSRDAEGSEPTEPAGARPDELEETADASPGTAPLVPAPGKLTW